MNKINICISEKDAIKGYSNVSVSQVPSIVNGSIDDILFKGLDAIPYDQRTSVTIDILNKLKHNGTATFEFFDMLSLGRDIYNGSATSKYVSSIIQNRSSIGCENDLVELVGNLPQLKIKNRYHSDSNIVVVVHKELTNG